MLWLQCNKLLINLHNCKLIIYSSVLSDRGVLQGVLMNPYWCVGSDLEGAHSPSPGLEVLSVMHCITK